MSELYDLFNRHFQVVPADSTDLLEVAYQLRYKVYCKENPYFETNQFPDQMETDEYDSHSANSLVRSKATGRYTGLVRLILPDPAKPNELMPVEKYCDLNSGRAKLNLSTIPRESLAEISRFCISKEAKRTCSKKPSLVVDRSHCVDDQPTDAYDKSLVFITLGLFSGILRMSEKNNITHWLAIMQPALLRLLSRFGIHLHKMGPLVNYHGKRQPVIGSVDEVLSGIYENRRDVWETVTNYGEFSSPYKDIRSTRTATGY
jgi:N-acyl amino acid synthase of PEP-CTERM/exosortase system